MCCPSEVDTIIQRALLAGGSMVGSPEAEALPCNSGDAAGLLQQVVLLV